MATTSKAIDKSSWGPGPWQTEPDRAEWKDEATGLPCLATRGPGGHWCGYVGVPPSHPWHGRGYSDGEYPETPEARMDVHGGLTYAAACKGNICHTPPAGEETNIWWFGFDCAHAGDISPAHEHYYPTGIRDDVYRTLDYVQDECVSLAAQLAAVR